MSYRDWYVGMKVVCISESYTDASAPEWGEAIPLKGRIYTIRSFHRSGNIRLREIRNKRLRYIEGRMEYAFSPARFRPVQKRKTDISIFKAILESTPTDMAVAS